MGISVAHVGRNTLKFSFSKVIEGAAGGLATIYTATVLDLDEYGTYGLLAIWLMYATLIGPGITSAGAREIPVLLGRNKEKEALEVQNISMSAEILYTILSFTVILIASFFYSDPVLRTGLVIVAACYLSIRLTSIWSQIIFSREGFNTVALGNLIAAITGPVIVLISVHWLKVYALLVGPLSAQSILLIYYLKKGGLSFHFKLDRREVTRLIKVGIVLQIIGTTLWIFRMTDRTIIASTLPIEQLGLYTFAATILVFVINLSSDFGRVLQPILWKDAGKAINVFEGFKDTKKFAVYFALGTSAIIPVVQLAFFIMVSLITTKYTDSIPVFYVLSYNVFLASIGIIPNLILQSSIVNKQITPVYYYSIGLALNIIFDLLVIKLGYGVKEVAWVTIGTQGLVTFVLFGSIKKYVFKSMKEFFIFQIRILFPFLAVIPFYFFHNYLDSQTINMWIMVCISFATQAILWYLIVTLFYRDYLSINIKSIVQIVRKAWQRIAGNTA